MPIVFATSPTSKVNLNELEPVSYKEISPEIEPTGLDAQFCFVTGVAGTGKTNPNQKSNGGNSR